MLSQSPSPGFAGYSPDSAGERLGVDLDLHFDSGRDRDRAVQRSMLLVVGDERLRLLLPRP